jgi:hypothetical protein
MENIPQDPFMLLSYINTQLRDNYDSLSDLCKSLDINEQKLIEKLASAGFDYMSEIKQFR